MNHHSVQLQVNASKNKFIPLSIMSPNRLLESSANQMLHGSHRHRTNSETSQVSNGSNQSLMSSSESSSASSEPSQQLIVSNSSSFKDVNTTNTTMNGDSSIEANGINDTLIRMNCCQGNNYNHLNSSTHLTSLQPNNNHVTKSQYPNHANGLNDLNALRELLQMLRFREQHPNSPLSQFIDPQQVMQKIKCLLPSLLIHQQQYESLSEISRSSNNSMTTMNSQQSQSQFNLHGNHHCHMASDVSMSVNSGHNSPSPPPSQGCFPLKLELTERDLLEFYHLTTSSSM
nr:unnamed protein product [Naegleria fowleri]